MSPRHGTAGKGVLLTALLLFLGAQFLFILVDATGKYLVRDFPVLAVVWARYFFHFLFMAAYVALAGGRGLLATKRPGLQLARGVMVFVFAIFLFAALKHCLRVVHAARSGADDQMSSHLGARGEA